jgi:phenylpropionate dioxygenase-like ring-hydroxylating dioxygenase large terminal subunit
VKRYPLPPYPNGWFKICFSDELARGEAKPVHEFGTELVVFRGEDGRARVLDAFCPHLGAHLGYGGRVEGTEIRCPFHAWRFDGESGRCTEIPYAKKIPARAELRSWPVIERNGYVAAWHHVEGKPPSFDIPVVPEVSDPGYRLYRRVRWEISTHLQELYENAVDIKHFAHVHGMDVQKVNWIPDGAHVALHLDIGRDADVQTDAAGETSFRSYMWGPGLSLTRVTGRMAGVSVQTLTPIDDEKIEITHNYWVKKDESLPREQVEAFYDFYAKDWELDFNLWNHKVFRPRPLLAEGDGDIGRYRRWYKQFYSVDVQVDF